MRRHVYPQTVVSVSKRYENPTNHVDLVQSGPHHYLNEERINCSCHDIDRKLLSWR